MGASAPVLALGLVSALLAKPAAAQGSLDGVEPHGFVEPCTIGNVQEMYTECELCAVPAGAQSPCDDRFGARGYEKKCRTHGDANGFEEVWCVDTRRIQQKPEPLPTKAPWGTIIGIPVLTAVLWLVKRLLTRRGDRLLK